MILAQMAGIEIFGTGGLGGVHRGGESSMDISADLTELGRTPVTVISSGCKSFLDIPRTLEYLETQGVTVGTFADGRSGGIDLPAFWTRDSGVRSPLVVENEEEAAAIICKCFEPISPRCRTKYNRCEEAARHQVRPFFRESNSVRTFNPKVRD
jgi:pseudouridylate synthase / pseudouridine kinase